MAEKTGDGQSGGINISGTIGSVGGDIVGRDKIVNIGPSADEIVARIEAKYYERGALERGLVLKLAGRLKQTEMLDFDQAVRELEHAVDVALDVIERGERPASQDDFVNAVLARVAEKTRTGDLEDGASEIDRALAQLEAQQLAFRKKQVSLLEEAVKLEILRREPYAVAQRIEAIVAADHPTDRAAWLPQFRERYIAFYEEGQRKGINLSLSIAIELAQLMLTKARDKTERGTAGNLLGNALLELGRHEIGSARLEEAANAYRAALKEHTRDVTALDWAKLQSNLGNALAALGERETGTERFEKAVAAYNAAMEERTRDRVPSDWAKTQLNLGNALRFLGERQTGTTALVQAVAAYRAALEIFTREREPQNWATVQHNLGVALWRLGERDGGKARLEESLVAFRAAQEVRTRTYAPVQWAKTQNALGAALATLGERERGTARLAEAVATYRAALDELARDRVPFDWAVAQYNLGNALERLGERETGTEPLQEAVSAYRAALEELTREQPIWEEANRNLGIALAKLAERRT